MAGRDTSSAASNAEACSILLQQAAMSVPTCSESLLGGGGLERSRKFRYMKLFPSAA